MRTDKKCRKVKRRAMKSRKYMRLNDIPPDQWDKAHPPRPVEPEFEAHIDTLEMIGESGMRKLAARTMTDAGDAREFMEGGM